MAPVLGFVAEVGSVTQVVEAFLIKMHWHDLIRTCDQPASPMVVASRVANVLMHRIEYASLPWAVLLSSFQPPIRLAIP